MLGDVREVSATVGDEISLSMKAGVSCRCPPPTIQPFLSQLAFSCSCCPKSVCEMTSAICIILDS